MEHFDLHGLEHGVEDECACLQIATVSLVLKLHVKLHHDVTGHTVLVTLKFSLSRKVVLVEVVDQAKRLLVVFDHQVKSREVVTNDCDALPRIELVVESFFALPDCHWQVVVFTNSSPATDW